MTERGRGKILVIENDRGIGDVLHALLSDEGYETSIVSSIEPDAIRVAVGQIEPDCVVLDGESPVGYGASWGEAIWMHDRMRSVPVIMLTAHAQAVQEAKNQESERSRKASFSSVLAKPFDADEFLAAVDRAVAQAEPFDSGLDGEARRTSTLVEKLEAAGAMDVHVSTRREWASLRSRDGTLLQIYWWQRDGVYYVMRHAEAGGCIERIGRFHDLDTAIATAMTVDRSTAVDRR